MPYKTLLTPQNAFHLCTPNNFRNPPCNNEEFLKTITTKLTTTPVLFEGDSWSQTFLNHYASSEEADALLNSLLSGDMDAIIVDDKAVLAQQLCIAAKRFGVDKYCDYDRENAYLINNKIVITSDENLNLYVQRASRKVRGTFLYPFDAVKLFLTFALISHPSSVHVSR